MARRAGAGLALWLLSGISEGRANDAATAPSRAAVTTANWAAVGTIAHAVGAIGTPLKGDGNGQTLAVAALPDPTRALAWARDWTIWATWRRNGWSSTDPANDFDARTVAGVAGIGYQATPAWLVGIIAGRETLTDDITSIAGGISGHGDALGVYSGVSLLPNLRWDATLSWSRLEYDASIGKLFGRLNGTFSGDRWVATTGLTGVYALGGVMIEPSSKLYFGRERQGDVTGTLRALTTTNEIEVGRVSSGIRASVPLTDVPISRAVNANAGQTLVPTLGVFADYRFGAATLVNGAVGLAPPNGWSGRVSAALSLLPVNGVNLTLVAEHGGIGSSAPTWMTQALVGFAF